MIETRPCPTGCGRTVPYQGRGPRRRCDQCRDASIPRPYQPHPQPTTPPRPARGCPLTARQLQILTLLAEGLTYGHIARRIGIGTSTVRTHIHNAYNRLGVHNRAHAVILAAEQGWLTSSVTGGSAPREVCLLETVEQLLEELIEAVGQRRERLHITRAQDHYLREFEAYLREHTHTDIIRRRARTTGLLWQMLDEAGIERGKVSSQRHAA